MMKHLVLTLALAGSLAHAGSIFTTLADDNDFDGNMFDVSVGPNGLLVTAIDVNVGTGPLTIDVYTKPGSYVGSETNAAAWTLDSSTAVTGLGAGLETFVAVTPFLLPANTITGMYVTIDTNVDVAPFMFYTNGNNVYSNADLTLTTGTGLGGLFGSLSVNPSRTWNGEIDYQFATPEPASMWLIGLGLAVFLAVKKRFA